MKKKLSIFYPVLRGHFGPFMAAPGGILLCVFRCGLRDLKGDGTVIGTHNVGVNGRRAKAWYERLRNDEVVDAPPDVARAGIAEVAPPGVVATAGFEDAKCIDETRIEKRRKGGALLRCKPRVFDVLLWVGQVNLSVCQGVVVAVVESFFLFELFGVLL